MNVQQHHAYALLHFGGLRLCFPQQETVDIGMVGAIRQADTNAHTTVGELPYQGELLPVFSLSADLALLEQLSGQCRICVSFSVDEQGSFALACDAVEPLQLREETRLHPLPEPMITDFTPLRSLLIQGQELAYVSDAGAMQAYLSHAGRLE